MLGWIVGGLILAGTILILTYCVSEFVQKTNLVDVLKGAFQSAAEKNAKKILAQVIKARIKSKDVNVICIDALDIDTDEAYEIQIKSEQGIDENIEVDDTYLISI